MGGRLFECKRFRESSGELPGIDSLAIGQQKSDAGRIHGNQQHVCD
jgi:hypothetical protein